MFLDDQKSADLSHITPSHVSHFLEGHLSINNNFYWVIYNILFVQMLLCTQGSFALHFSLKVMNHSCFCVSSMLAPSLCICFSCPNITTNLSCFIESCNQKKIKDLDILQLQQKGRFKTQLTYSTVSVFSHYKPNQIIQSIQTACQHFHRLMI